MSILIKGMDMPTNCENCRLWYQDQDSEHNVWSRCTALNHNEIIAFRTIRRADCPLVEVPTPHGRLIDADALEDKLNGLFRTRDYDTIDFYNHAIADCIATVKNVPTIIEAEEGTEE